MNPEAIDALLDQLEAAMRDLADAMQKLHPDRGAVMAPSQTLRMLSIVARFGELMGPPGNPCKQSFADFLERMADDED